MTDIAELELRAKTDSLKTATAEMDKVTVAAKKVATEATAMGSAVEKSGGVAAKSATGMSGALGRLGAMSSTTKSQIQNVSYQFQDMAVQMQMGTSASVILAQQGAQIASAFGPVGAIVGTLAAVGIPVLALAFSSLSTETVTLKDATDDLSESVGTFRTAVDNASLGFGDLFAEFGPAALRVQALYGAMLQLEEGSARGAFGGAVDALKTSITDLGDAGSGWFSNLGGNLLLGVQKSFNMTEASALRLTTALSNMRTASGPDEQAAAAWAIARAMANAEYNTGGASAAALEFARDAASVAVEAARIEKNTLDAKAAANALGSADVSSRISEGAVEAARLAGNLQAAVTAANNLGPVKAFMSLYGSRGKVMPTTDAAPVTSARPRPAPLGAVGVDWGAGSVDLHGGGGGAGAVDLHGGGGGAGADSFESDLEAIIADLRTEREATDAWYAEGQELLADKRAQEVLGAQGHADALVAIEEEMVRRKAEARDQDLGHYEGFFGSMASALSSGSGKMLKISKAFGLAEAAVSIWRGAAKALELPFPASLAAWGQVISTGASALAGIKSASATSASVSRGSTASSVGSTTASAVTDQRVRIEVAGDGIFSDFLRDNVDSIAKAISNSANMGGTTVVVGR